MSAVAFDNISHGGRRQATRVDDIDGRFDPWLLGVSIALACFGVVMVGSAAVAGAGMDVGPWYFLSRHAVFLAVGIVLAAIAMRTELKTVEQHSQLLLLLCVVLLLAVFLPGIGKTVNGARRWLNLGISNFQAVEAVKVIYIVWLASYLKRYSEDVAVTWMARRQPTMAILAPTRRGRPSGVAPSRLSTPYWRSKPVPIPRLTMALDITARARMPGVRKSTGSATPAGMGSTSTSEKNTSRSSGMPMLTRSCSPCRRLSRSSVRSWAANGLIAALVPGRAAERRVRPRPGPRPSGPSR